uniref:hypothetical protein n=1 Tax=Bacteroides eggerthii TaxID=28111 RepID=UPI00359CA562
KVADLGIRTKYTRPFLPEISKLFHKWLIDKQVEEHDFLKGNKGERKIHNIYTHARTGGRIGGHKGGRFQAGHYLQKAT